jgi:hypothetical protein
MLEFTLTGNIGKEPRVVNDTARATVCCNTPINGTGDTEPVWVDIEATQHSRNGERLLAMNKGDGIMVRGVIRINYYMHNNAEKKGWVMAINQLNLMFNKYV